MENKEFTYSDLQLVVDPATGGKSLRYGKDSEVGIASFNAAGTALIDPVSGFSRYIGKSKLGTTPVIGLIGDSIVAADITAFGQIRNSNANGIVSRILAQLGSSAKIASYATAVAGYTTTQILAALPAAITTMRGLGVTHVFMNGGKNDIVGTDNTNANLLQIWTQLLDADFFVIDIGCLPTTGPAGTQTIAVEIAKATSRNKYTSQFSAVTANFVYVDCYTPLLDVTSVANASGGVPAAGMLYDSTHPAPLGAEKIAKAYPKLWEQLFGLSQNAPVWPASGNIIPNPLQIGSNAATGGNFTGVRPDSWLTTSLSSLQTTVGSKVARASSLFADLIPGEVWRHVITNTSANTNAFVIYQNISLAGTGLAAGDVVRGAIELKWQGNAAGKILQAQLAGAIQGSTAQTIQAMNVGNLTTLALQSTSGGGLFYTPEITLLAGATDVNFWVYVSIAIGTASDTVTLDVGRAYFGKSLY